VAVGSGGEVASELQRQSEVAVSTYASTLAAILVRWTSGHLSRSVAVPPHDGYVPTRADRDS
jgi:hypothetical protein